MVRTTLGILIGALTATLVLAGAAYGFAEVHRVPAAAELADPDLLADFMTAAPATAVAVLLGGLALAALLGAWLAARIGSPHPGGAALAIGALLTLAVIFQATLFPHPEWLIVAALLLPIPFACVAAMLSMPRLTVPARQG